MRAPLYPQCEASYCDVGAATRTGCFRALHTAGNRRWHQPVEHPRLRVIRSAILVQRHIRGRNARRLLKAMLKRRKTDAARCIQKVRLRAWRRQTRHAKRQQAECVPETDISHCPARSRCGVVHGSWCTPGVASVQGAELRQAAGHCVWLVLVVEEGEEEV